MIPADALPVPPVVTGPADSWWLTLSMALPLAATMLWFMARWWKPALPPSKDPPEDPDDDARNADES